MPTSPDDPGARIVCAAGDEMVVRVTAGTDPTFATLAAGVAVGAAMASRVVCVRPELPLAEVFGAERSVLLPVVDAAGKLIGVLWRPDLTPAPFRKTIELRARLASFPLGVVAERMDTQHAVLHETSPLVDALRAMTVNHARSLPVVAEGEMVVGMISDIDLLTWLGRARRRFTR